VSSKQDEQDLRRRAEERHQARHEPGKPAEQPREVLLHELEVHQIELEIQNEELRRTQARLEVALARYQDLFDLAPLGYVSMRPDGLIIKANLTAASMLGIPRLELVHDKLIRYASPGFKNVLLHHLQRVFAGLGPETCELELTRGDGGQFVAHLQSTVQPVGEDTEPQCLTAISDVTEQRRREEALRKTQEQSRLFVEQAPISIAMFDREMRYIATSRRWIAEYGQGHTNLIGRSHYEIHPNLSAEWKQVHREALGGAFINNDEDLWIQDDGSRHWLRWAAHPWVDDAGAIGGIIISAEDITQRKLAEEALHRSQADLNRAQAVGCIGSWRLDVRNNELTWSPENHRIFGIPEGTPLSYETFLSKVHPDDREDVDRLWQACLRGEPYDVEHRLVVDGEVKWVRERAELELDQDGMLLGGFGTTQDVTEKREAEDKLRQQLLLFNAITDCAASSIFVTDGNGRITFVNTETERAFGFQDSELIGKTLHHVIHHHYPDGRPYPFEECPNCFIYKRGEAVRNHEAVFFRKDGSSVAVSCSNSSLDVGGVPEGAVLVVHDITDLKRAQEALREADRRKDAFLATLAHELRNPMAPIRNAVEVLKIKMPLDPFLQTARDIIDRQSKQMVRLIDDLLDVSRITRGRLELRRERVDLGAILEQTIETSRPHLELAQHQLTLSLPSPPISLDADPVRMTQVFVNLLNNGCKYTPTGGKITLSAERDGPDAVIKVTDSGRGIPPESLSRLFEMFSRVESDPELVQGGVGIGLWLARGLVEMHGGDIEAHSEGLGKGSEFRVRLPAMTTDVDATQPEVRRPFAGANGRRILVVDDNRDIVDSMVMLLEVSGHQVKTARDGLEAIEAAAQYRPDVILLDIGMPTLDGYATCRRIREESWGKDILIVALSGWGQHEDRQKSEKAGFNGHLIKPLDPDALFRLLGEHAD
jgi:PAS domain S-box-containing protein